MTSSPPGHSDKVVCIVGLGFVGVTLAAAMADCRFTVIGVEIRDEVRERLASGEAHFFEPGLSSHLRKAVASGRLTVHASIPENCPASAYIITVGTPLDPAGQVDLSSITRITREIAQSMVDGAMVILRSTVKLGTTRNAVEPLLRASGKSFDLAYCPERTVEGQAMAELRVLPQIIGADTPAASVRAAQLFQLVTPTVVRVSDSLTAEMIKLVDNAKRDVLFAYANEVAHLCDAVGISAAEVIRSGRFGYSRTDLPLPGPVGGPCLSKDSYILAQSVAPYGLDPAITVAARSINEALPKRVTEFLAACPELRDGAPAIAVLGFAFKGTPPTDDVRGTTAKPLVDALRKAFPAAEIRGYDPVVGGEVIRTLGAAPAGDLAAAIAGAALVVIQTNHPAFAAMDWEVEARHLARPAVIYDLWNMFVEAALDLPAGVRYTALGSHGKR